jgi:hypothetical protein
VYWDRKSRPEFGMCSVRFIQWFLTKNIKEKTGDLKCRLEWAGFRFTQCPVSSGFTVCSMCIQINKVGKQKVGIWWDQKRYPKYGIPIWCLWPNIRFLPSTVTEKNATKNILDRRKDGRTEVKQYTPLPLRGAGV